MQTLFVYARNLSFDIVLANQFYIILFKLQTFIKVGASIR